jgi:hypothetical protein
MAEVKHAWTAQQLAREITLDELDGELTAIARGELQGRTVVRVAAS